MSKARDNNDSNSCCYGRQLPLNNRIIDCDAKFLNAVWASVKKSANCEGMGCLEHCPNHLLEVIRLLRNIDEKFHSFRELFQGESNGELSGPIEVKLTDLLEIISSFLDKYPVLSHHAIRPAIASLIASVNDFNSQQTQRGTESKKRYSEIFRSLDALEISIGNEAIEMLMDGTDDSSAEIPNSEPEKPQTDESFCDTNLRAGESTNLSVEEADEMLIKCDGGVEAALDYAKMWCKYVKELLNWEEKRLSYEIEFAKNIMKIAEAGRNAIYSQRCLPLQNLYTMVMEHDIRAGNLAVDTAGALHDREYYEPLWAKRNEIEKWRKEFKDQWQKEQKKMDYSLSSMRKSRLHYNQRCEELQKAKLLSAKAEEEFQGTTGSGNKQLEKRRRYQDEAQMKVNESEVLYKTSVFDANNHRLGLEKVRERIISHIRKLMFQGDEVLMRVTLRMFKLQRAQAERIPEGYENLTKFCEPYKSGEKYLEFIQKLQKRELPIEIYKFEEYVVSRQRSPSATRRKNIPQHSHISSSAIDLSNSMEDASGKPSSTSSEQSTNKSYSDTESLGGSITECHSFDSPTSSPGHKKLLKAPSTGTVSSSEDCEDKYLIQAYENELTEASSENGLSHYAFKNINLSSAAQTHRLRKLRGPSKCRECDNFMVNGLECEECLLTCHKKCLESLLINCGHQKLPARMPLFGIDFTQVPRDFPEEVPFIVVKCTSELEARALGVQGIYRISGAKARMERLCQAFENGRGLVELSDHSPHDITGVLKHFLKELSSPVLPYKLYDEFMTHAKSLNRPEDKTGGDSETLADLIKNTKDLLSKLPATNYNTLRHLIAHLYRVAENYEENKMSPNNLGIIFGPTLIRPPFSNDVSMSSLIDSGYQSQLVEFLILNYERIFGMDDLPSSGLCERDNSLRRANVNEALSSNERDFDVSSENSDCKPSPNEDDSFTEDWSSAVDRSLQGTLQTDAVNRDTTGLNSEDGTESKHTSLDPDAISSQTRGRFSRTPVKHPRTIIPKAPSLSLLPSLYNQQAISGLLESSPSSRSASPDTRGNRKHFETAKHTPETARIVSKLQGKNGNQDCSQPELGTPLCKKPVDAPTES